MIPSEDLMIGNYVFDNFDAKNPYKITRISLDDFVAMSNGCNSYQPIPLFLLCRKMPILTRASKHVQSN